VRSPVDDVVVTVVDAGRALPSPFMERGWGEVVVVTVVDAGRTLPSPFM
jgi:hypothetical protein